MGEEQNIKILFYQVTRKKIFLTNSLLPEQMETSSLNCSLFVEVLGIVSK